MDGNEFIKNSHIQVKVINRSFYGSLIEYASAVPTSRINIRRNYFEQNYHIGQDLTLVDIDGGIIEITDNVMIDNGYLSLKSIAGNPQSVPLNATESFPYSSFNYQNASESGIFTFYFMTGDIPAGYSHYIARNKFSHIFCLYGCAYTVKSITIQQFYFEENEYDYLFSFEGGTAYSGKLINLKPNSKTPFIAMFKNEVMKNQIGTAIDIKNINDAGFIIIESCIFYNNYSSHGASIRMEKGGALIALNNHFS